MNQANVIKKKERFCLRTLEAARSESVDQAMMMSTFVCIHLMVNVISLRERSNLKGKQRGWMYTDSDFL